MSLHIIHKKVWSVVVVVACMGLLAATELHAASSDVSNDAIKDDNLTAAITPTDLLATMPVSDQQLNTYRGGFFNSGLMLSLGIERVLYINGQLTTAMALNSTLPASIDSSTRSDVSTSLSSQTAALPQGSNGPVHVTTNLNFSAPLYVQNTLPHQTIGIVTVINATTNTASLLKTLNFSSTLRDAINASAH